MENYVQWPSMQLFSHPDGDHIGGFERLLSNNEIKTDDLYLFVPQFSRHWPLFLYQLTIKYQYRKINDGYLSLHRDAVSKPQPEERDDEFKVDLISGQVSLIYPLHGSGEDSNANSILLRVENPKILLSGDSTGPVIWRHINVHDRETLHTFHVPHHGSRENSLAPISATRGIDFQWARLIAAKILKENEVLYIALSKEKQDH